MSNTTLVTPNPDPAKVAPEEVIAQLRTIRSQIDEAPPLSKEQSKLVKQRLRIQPIILLAAFPNQPQLAGTGHNHFVPQLAQHPADPG